MGIYDSFKSFKHTQDYSDDRFWEGVRKSCINHVEKTISFFKSMNATHLDWAEPRFQALISNSALDKVINKAKELLIENPDGSIIPVPIQEIDSWYVVLSVFPSEVDIDFLSACPKSSYESLVLDIRKNFRETIDNWKFLDFAHWILLINDNDFRASIHLDTIWSYKKMNEWFVYTEKDDLPKLIPAPMIVPVNLIKENFERFRQELWKQDAIFIENKRSNNIPNAERQIKELKDVLSQVRIAIFLLSDHLSEQELINDKPASLETYTINNNEYTLLELRISHFKWYMKQLNLSLPIILVTPDFSYKQVNKYIIKNKFFGLEEKNFFHISEESLPAQEMKDNEFKFVKSSLSPLGALYGLCKVICNGIFTNLYENGISHLFISQIHNLGATIEPQILEGIYRDKNLSICELISCDKGPINSRFVQLKKEKKHFLVHDKRIESDDFAELRESIDIGSTDVFWFNIKDVLGSFGLDPQFLPKSSDVIEIEKVLNKYDPLITYQDGIFITHYTLYDITTNLPITGINVSSDRFWPNIRNENGWLLSDQDMKKFIEKCEL